MTTKATNPKQAVGDSKVPLHQNPLSTEVFLALGHLDGLLKYGQRNFDLMGVSLSTYIGALKRHASRMQEGEWLDPDSGLPHLCHILACASIVADASVRGMLNDDRAPAISPMDGDGPMDFSSVEGLMLWASREVIRLRELHAGKDPQHFTIKDTIGLNEREYSPHSEHD